MRPPGCERKINLIVSRDIITSSRVWDVFPTSPYMVTWYPLGQLVSLCFPEHKSCLDMCPG